MKNKKLKVFPTAQFLAWLVTQGERKFQYTDSGRCAVASFAKEALKLKGVSVGPGFLGWANGESEIPEAVESAICDKVDDNFTASEALAAFRSGLTEFPTEIFLEWLDWQGSRLFQYSDNYKCFAASFVKEVLGHPEAATCSGFCVGVYNEQRFRLPDAVIGGLNKTSSDTDCYKKARASTAAKKIRELL